LTSVSPKIKPVVALEVDNANASKRSWLSRLKLDHFRNYQQANLLIHAGLNSDMVEFALADQGSPSLVRAPGDEASLFVLMPMRV